MMWCMQLGIRVVENSKIPMQTTLFTLSLQITNLPQSLFKRRRKWNENIPRFFRTINSQQSPRTELLFEFEFAPHWEGVVLINYLWWILSIFENKIGEKMYSKALKLKRTCGVNISIILAVDKSPSSNIIISIVSPNSLYICNINIHKAFIR